MTLVCPHCKAAFSSAWHRQACEKPVPQGNRRVPITVVFHLYEDVPAHWEDGGRFYIEENHCIDNYVTELAEDIERDANHCQTCNRANAYLGHIPFADIVKIQDAMPDQGFTPATQAPRPAKEEP